MFETESIEQANKKYPIPKVCNELEVARNRKYEEGFKDGAEFGYNKANEWHYIKNGYVVKRKDFYLIAIKGNGLALAYWNGLHWETKYNMGDSGHRIETVIAWKEIVPPKEIKE